MRKRKKEESRGYLEEGEREGKRGERNSDRREGRKRRKEKL